MPNSLFATFKNFHLFQEIKLSRYQLGDLPASSSQLNWDETTLHDFPDSAERRGKHVCASDQILAWDIHYLLNLLIRSTETCSNQTKLNQFSNFPKEVVVGQKYYSLTYQLSCKRLFATLPYTRSLKCWLSTTHNKELEDILVRHFASLHYNPNWKRFPTVLERGNKNRNMQSDAKYYAEI